jgi:DNA-binding MarR family transcriptional regulator
MSRKDRLPQDPPSELPTPRLLSLAYNQAAAAITARIVAAGFKDLRPSHGNVMEHLTFEDGARLTDLAARAGITPQSMTQLVDELEQLGYVERRLDSADRRAKRIHLTRRGKRCIQVSWDVVREVDRDLHELVGSRRFADLRATLMEISQRYGVPQDS